MCGKTTITEKMLSLPGFGNCYKVGRWGGLSFWFIKYKRELVLILCANNLQKTFWCNIKGISLKGLFKGLIPNLASKYWVNCIMMSFSQNPRVGKWRRKATLCLRKWGSSYGNHCMNIFNCLVNNRVAEKAKLFLLLPNAVGWDWLCRHQLRRLVLK